MIHLILDCDYLCHRLFYAVGGGGHSVGLVNGVIFGFLRDIINLQNIHYADRMLFCWDHGVSKREKILPSYKSSRKLATRCGFQMAGQPRKPRDYRDTKDQLREQMRLLKLKILHEIGFRNILFSEGYEADDMITSVCECLPKGDTGIIVSTDKDLYQCLTEDISMWNPIKKESYTQRSLWQEYGVLPKQWVEVKAMAGCKGDDIPGIPKIGEASACQYLRGVLSDTAHKYKLIQDNFDFWTNNMKLVRLPFEGCPHFMIDKEEVTDAKWNSTLDRYGMKSLRMRAPIFPEK